MGVLSLPAGVAGHPHFTEEGSWRPAERLKLATGHGRAPSGSPLPFGVSWACHQADPWASSLVSPLTQSHSSSFCASALAVASVWNAAFSLEPQKLFLPCNPSPSPRPGSSPKLHAPLSLLTLLLGFPAPSCLVLCLLSPALAGEVRRDSPESLQSPCLCPWCAVRASQPPLPSPGVLSLIHTYPILPPGQPWL